MTGYVRPRLEVPVFRDADGAIIPYGERWGVEAPPTEAYSRTSNLERYAPLHDVASALIAHLERTYDVMIRDDLDAADLMHERGDIVRAVRVTPADRRSAPLTFVFTNFPSVIVHAGLLSDLLYPFCGCDACDESVGFLADELEWQVLAIAEGQFSEEIIDGSPPTLSHSIWDESGRSGGTIEATDAVLARVEAARPVLAGLPEGWRSWPRRGD